MTIKKAGLYSEIALLIWCVQAVCWARWRCVSWAKHTSRWNLKRLSNASSSWRRQSQRPSYLCISA